MEASLRSTAERRSGRDRRQNRDAHYRGVERRSGVDRRLTMRVADPARDRSGVAFGSSEAATPACLHPVNGNPYLSPLIVAMRIAAEFAYVEADEAAGRDHVVRLITAIESKKRRVSDSAIEERLTRLERIKDRAIQVCFGDDPGCDHGYLCTVAIPGEPLLFEYESAAHRKAAQTLLERCARVLGYAIMNRAA